MRLLGSVALAVFLALSSSACRSTGGPPKPQAPAATVLPDVLQAWIGQKRLIAGAGEAPSLALKSGESLPKGDCDVAVQVRTLDFEKGSVSLLLDTLGRAQVEGRMRGRECREVPAGRRLAVSGLASADDAAAALERLLATPESHLAARDVPFDLPADDAPPKLAAVPPEGEGTSEERSLGRRLTEWPRPLLAVHPLVSGRVRHQGEVEFAGTVGADGRLYKATLVTSLAQPQEDQVLGVFSLWRYQPAKMGEERVAARVRGRATLQIR
jgi:hypothetical protein